jgi:hypothetical protein
VAAEFDCQPSRPRSPSPSAPSRPPSPATPSSCATFSLLRSLGASRRSTPKPPSTRPRSAAAITAASSLGANRRLTLPLFPCAGRRPPEPVATAVYPRAPVAVVPQSGSRRLVASGAVRRPRSVAATPSFAAFFTTERRRAGRLDLTLPVHPLPTAVAAPTPPSPVRQPFRSSFRCPAEAGTPLTRLAAPPSPLLVLYTRRSSARARFPEPVCLFRPNPRVAAGRTVQVPIRPARFGPAAQCPLSFFRL